MNRNKKSLVSTITLTMLAAAALAGCAPQVGPEDATSALTEESIDTTAASLTTFTKKSFLDTVMGDWSGNCSILWPGSPDSVQDVGMERNVHPTGDPGRYTWQIVYHFGSTVQVRDYTLIVIDEAAGHYQVDENNGIIIDMYYYAPGVLTQLFDVGTVRIVGHETFNGKSSSLQFLTTGLTPKTTSGAEPYVVNSYGYRTNQYCTLQQKSKT